MQRKKTLSENVRKTCRRIPSQMTSTCSCIATKNIISLLSASRTVYCDLGRCSKKPPCRDQKTLLGCVNSRSSMSEFAQPRTPLLPRMYSVMQEENPLRTNVAARHPLIWSCLPTVCHLITRTTMCGFASTETLASHFI